MAIRNILRTDLYRGLRACRNLRIVIFSPLLDEEFQREVGGENVILEPLQKWKAGPLVKTLRSLRKDVWSEKHELARFKEKRASRKGQLGRAIVYYLLLRDKSGNRTDRALEKISRWEQKFTPPLGANFEILEKRFPCKADSMNRSRYSITAVKLPMSWQRISPSSSGIAGWKRLTLSTHGAGLSLKAMVLSSRLIASPALETFTEAIPTTM